MYDEIRRSSDYEWPDAMYVTTFYSFKGGVGRTMALVNAAIELANTGRRVLAVDFDLEAPGLDTFDFLPANANGPGIIDFVGEYLASGQAPEVDRFISETSDIGDVNGGLWIMPSGAQHETYAAKFSQIDWGKLYEEHDGYLLFEDLKKQWEQVVCPHYVLIDSRTGHTDTGGICTRQLPDAVAIFFFPNEQNLRGLTKVVRDIRLEANAPRKKEIDLHFVMSNVPDLDDEDRILEGKISAFQSQLGFRREPTVVHRYDSLSLLNQVVFTKDRPKSRLATEYRTGVREIVRCNLADRAGALDHILRAGQHRGRRRESPRRRDEQLQKIEEMHSDDGEVLFRLGELREDDRQLEQAAALFGGAIEFGYDVPKAYRRRARIRAASDDPDGASEDALRALQFDPLPPHVVREAIMLAGPENLGMVAESKAVVSLDSDARIWLATTLVRSLEEIKTAVSILEPLVSDDSVPEEERSAAGAALAWAYIGIGKCAEASKLLRQRHDVGDMDIQSTFNYGMALWGETRAVVAAPFERAVELDQSAQEREDPNYLQCMAVAYWAAGDTKTAVDFVHLARKAVSGERGSTFSCWRYCRVSTTVFSEDLDDILGLIGGDASRTPRFMAAALQGK